MRYLLDPQCTHFICGLALAALGALAALLHSRGDRSLPWPWLTAFCGVQFVAEAIQLILSLTGQTTSLEGIRAVGTAIASFILLEFGRRGIAARGPAWLKSWIHLPLAALASGGLFVYGLQGFDVGARYAVALPSGLIAAWALWLAARPGKDPSRVGLSIAALSVVLYGALTAVNVDLGRAIAAVGILSGMWYEHHLALMPAKRLGLRRWWAPAAFAVLAIVGVCFFAGGDNPPGSATVLVEQAQVSTADAPTTFRFELERPRRNNADEQRYKQGMSVLAIAGVVVVVWILAARYAAAQ